jgi:hypothetical protein
MPVGRDAASQPLRRIRAEVALNLLVLMVVSACSPVSGAGNEDALSTVDGSDAAKRPDPER